MTENWHKEVLGYLSATHDGDAGTSLSDELRGELAALWLACTDSGQRIIIGRLCSLLCL